MTDVNNLVTKRHKKSGPTYISYSKKSFIKKEYNTNKKEEHSKASHTDTNLCKRKNVFKLNDWSLRSSLTAFRYSLW